MKLYKNPSRESWSELLLRPAMSIEEIEKQVQPILKAVQNEGDAALRAFSLQFDRADIDSFLVSNEEFEEAEKLVAPELKESISIAIENITKFHAAQKTETLKVETMKGIQCWRKSVPIQKVGLYIPGGTAPLFSTVIMIGAPALIAGCEEVFLCTPPNSEGKIHPAILYAAKKIGLTKVFKVGGAQAIAAMTYGTESIPKVSKIFGPGNQYVTAAKQLATKEGIAIDMPAGPSEVLVWADDTAHPSFIAADLLSQAEHGTDSQVILVSSSEETIRKTEEELEKQLAVLPRQEIARKALNNSRSFLIEDEATALDLVNEYAAEHLILSLSNAEEVAEKIINAGSVFVGHYTPESAGDYASGTNHTLPTYGYAKNYSGVSLDSYYRKITFQKIDKEGLKTLGPHVERMAAAEELDAHKNAITVRLKEC
ncbi:histidinol dehydrogenase [Flammeovirga sp. SJP92]|uniref:histidinol dehydrogenase n=1 Tax=Flammeovirga sp. SJP92 TaxID=1775430 RepID=UPI0007898B45|nr:histidinol dehydrogenase [Flammeovirga sp. SJP92]KXX70677.1 histidinol dehydrogenase [Flammeovirga sp. SJP92]